MSDEAQSGQAVNVHNIQQGLFEQKSQLHNRLFRLVESACGTIPGCDHAGITLVKGQSAMTVAASDEKVFRADLAQYQANEGPCLEAALKQEPFDIPETRTDQRFTAFSSVADQIGIESVLSVPIRVGNAVHGSLNLYADRVRAYSDASIKAASAIVAEAQAALSLSEDIEELLLTADIYDVGDLEGHLDAKAKAKSVLIIDDSAEMRELLHLVIDLTDNFYVKDEATNGLEGVRAATVEQPDVIVLDLEMPIMNGWEALPEIHRASPGSKVVVFSSFSGADDAELRSLGAAHLVQKGSGASMIAELKRAISED